MHLNATYESHKSLLIAIKSMKKITLLSILFLNICNAQAKENYLNETKAECQFSFQSITECPYKTPEYAVVVNIESEKIANDEKSIKKINVSINGSQQTLMVSQDTSILDGDIGYISFADINFDNVPDLALTTSFGTPNLYLDYWIFDPKLKNMSL